MHISSIFPSKNSLQNPDLKQSTKEEFFAVKRKHRRLKSSTFLTEQTSSKQKSQEQKLLKTTQPTINVEIHKDLESTFGSDHYLKFRSKPPKRKTNIKAKIINGEKLQVESSQDECMFSSMIQRVPLKKQNKQKYEKQGHPKPKNWNIDDFICLAKIGQGSYSEVFKVIEKKSRFVCSMKALRKQRIREMNFQQNLLRQIKINLFLNHPHIIKLYGFFSDQSYVYLLFEYATEQNLYDRLITHKAKNVQPIHISQTQTFITHICLALNYMHNHSILHRDIKPQNVLITFSNTIKVCDFGWSIYNPDKSLRATICGTPLYLAPQLIKQNQYNELVDVWATGVLTYELLTNEIPFKIKSLNDLKKVATSEIRYDKITDLEARQFISFALQRNRQDRKSINELLKCDFIQRHLQSQEF